MNIKELIKQKKAKKIKVYDRLSQKKLKENNNLENNNLENDNKNKEDNFIENNLNSISNRPTTKVNNIPCDHSQYVFINPDTISHIKLKNKNDCQNDCSEHPCTFLCPSHVYGWTKQGLKVDYQRCVECGACNIFCPSGNIQWSYPRSGYGIQRKY